MKPCLPAAAARSELLLIVALVFAAGPSAADGEAPCPDTEQISVAGEEGVCTCLTPAAQPLKRFRKAPAVRKPSAAPKKPRAAGAAPKPKPKPKPRPKPIPAPVAVEFPCPPPLTVPGEAAGLQVAPPPREPPPVAAAPALVEEAPWAPRRPSRLWTYGELHYINFVDDELPGTPRTEIWDLQRLNAGISHSLRPSLRLVAEVEAEHALTSRGPGRDRQSFHVKQAMVETDLPAQQTLRAGLMLAPVGIYNRDHDPTTYYGVERNPVESEIIPTTWFEPGVSMGGPFADSGAGYELAVLAGLHTPGAGEPNAYRLRNGTRQRGDPNDNSLGLTARLYHQVVPGLMLGLGMHREDDIRQGEDPQKVPATLLEADMEMHAGRLSSRVVLARWDVDSPDAEAIRRDVQIGGYGELGWLLRPRLGSFVRFTEWDRGGANGKTRTAQWMVGANYWPNRNWVLKTDVKTQSGASPHTGFHFGLGWRFP